MQSYFPKEGDWKPEDKHWSSKRDPVEQSCFVKLPRVIMSQEVDLKVRLLLKKVPTEWLGYLCGRRDNGDFLVDDLVIPEQKVTSTTVNGVEPVANSNILGSVHCHPWKGKPSASGTDTQYLLSNHDLSIIVSSKGEYTCYTRIKARCGITVVEKVDVELDLSGLQDWLKKAVDKMKQPTHYYYEGGLLRKSPLPPGAIELLPPGYLDGGLGD